MAIDSKLIARNTVLLYIRMIFLMVISLYTSRIVLAALGVEDYGIYNVVGGVVSVLGFLNATITTSSSRFITVALASGDSDNMSNTFSTVLLANAFLFIIILVLAESLGLWFFYEKMSIPGNRLNAAFWVYQFSIATIACNIFSVPFSASITAHEKMDIFAYISLFDGFVKLAVALFLSRVIVDRLVFWGIGLLLIQIFNSSLYIAYCLIHFEECKLKYRFDKQLFKEIMKFILLSSYGSFASAGFTQGLNIILNLFFGPAINAARALSVQVQGAIMGFTSNFQTAINPQLIKNTSQKQFHTTKKMLITSSKISFVLLCLVALPVIAESGIVLKIWLKEVPSYTKSFCQIILIISVWSCLANPLRVINQAEGNIKQFQLIECSILLLIVPVSYYSVKIYQIPIIVFFVHLIFETIAQVARLIIVLPKIQMPIREYFKEVYLKLIPVFFFPLIISFCINSNFAEGLARFIINFFAIELSIILLLVFLILNQEEKGVIKQLFYGIIHREK